MRTYARIHADVVAELFTTAGNIGDLFSPLLVWVDVTDTPEVAIGWAYDGNQFKKPATVVNAPIAPLALLQAQLATLTQQIAALAKRD